jgi:hypothetical protein
MMAEVHLTLRRSKRHFIQCYQQLADKFQTAESYCLLAEAYMRIQVGGGEGDVRLITAFLHIFL